MKNTVYALAALLVTAPGEAQAPAERPALLRGFVLADSSEAPIGGAEVMIDALNIRVSTVADGAFRLPEIKPGIYLVSVRAVGYKRIWAQLAFADGDSLERDFLLLRSAVAIAGVRVTGKADTRNPELAEFERRRGAGFGGFITQQRIDSFPGKRLSNFMRELPGLAVQQGNTNNATWAVGTRGSGSMRVFPSVSEWDLARGAKRRTCYSAVYLDGIVVYSGKLGEALFDIDQLNPGDVAGIEYYASAAQTPPELNVTSSGTCGIVVIWTR